MFPAVVYVASTLNSLSSAVNHPINLYPVFVVFGLSATAIVPSNATVAVFNVVSSSLNVTLYVFAVYSTATVTSSPGIANVYVPSVCFVVVTSFSPAITVTVSVYPVFATGVNVTVAFLGATSLSVAISSDVTFIPYVTSCFVRSYLTVFVTLPVKLSEVAITFTIILYIPDFSGAYSTISFSSYFVPLNRMYFTDSTL